VFPSPHQCNWRLYLDDGADHTGGVLFVGNVMDSLLYTVAVRLCSDALPTHLARTFRHHADDRGCFDTCIDAGAGSAPDLAFHAVPAQDRELPMAFRRLFGQWREAVAWLTLREMAVAPVTDTGGLAIAGIDLPVDIDAVLPMALSSLRCEVARDMVSDAPAFCFALRAVPFRVRWERMLRG
jgi:hypothetical protein